MTNNNNALSHNATPPAPSLADEFDTLATRATPGQWHQHDGKDVVAGSFLGDMICRVWPNMKNEANDAAFIAFCGMHRDAILAALRAAESAARSAAEARRKADGK